MEKEQASAYRNEWTLEVLKLLIGRQNHLNETLRLTRELGTALDRNDRVSAQMLLEMRGEELEKIDDGLRKLQMFKEQLSEQTRGEIDELLQCRTIDNPDKNTDKIVEIVKNCKKLLQETITIDKRISKKVAGTDSFYQ
ncbi:MAG: hypothetical protein HFE76_00290 [Firmicutes bacterium]|nr:hypothetical protein [Bacillota bacterium]